MYIYVMNVDYECKYYVVFIYTASLQKVKSLRENLLACKSLLHCKREELKKYWMDGLEYNEVLNLLDRMWAIHNSCGLDLRGGSITCLNFKMSRCLSLFTSTTKLQKEFCFSQLCFLTIWTIVVGSLSWQGFFPWQTSQSLLYRHYYLFFIMRFSQRSSEECPWTDWEIQEKEILPTRNRTSCVHRCDMKTLQCYVL